MVGKEAKGMCSRGGREGGIGRQAPVRAAKPWSTCCLEQVRMRKVTARWSGNIDNQLTTDTLGILEPKAFGEH
jgi:hypothetical protein